MRIMALAMAGLLASAASAADAPHDWVGINTTREEDSMTFVDLPTITRDAAGIMTMRQSIVFMNEPQQTAAMTATVQVDCTKRQTRKLDIQGWRRDGTLIGGGALNEDWAAPRDGSVGDGMIDFVCNIPDLKDTQRYPRTSDALPTMTARRILSRSST